jgi:hypothetical protein
MKKRIFNFSIIALTLSVLVATTTLAASSIAVTGYSTQGNGSQLVIKLLCTAAADGTFTPYEIPDAISPGMPYWTQGYYLYEAWAVNPAAVFPTVAANVVITTEAGEPVLKSGELALSTDASGVAEAVMAKYRAINSKMTLAPGDTGAAANIFTLYLKLAR